MRFIQKEIQDACEFGYHSTHEMFEAFYTIPERDCWHKTAISKELITSFCKDMKTFSCHCNCVPIDCEIAMFEACGYCFIFEYVFYSWNMAKLPLSLTSHQPPGYELMLAARKKTCIDVAVSFSIRFWIRRSWPHDSKIWRQILSICCLVKGDQTAKVSGCNDE